MAKDPRPPATKETPSTLRRVLPYLVFAAVVVGFLMWYLGDAQSIQRHISALHSDNHKTRKEHLDHLRAHPKKKLVNDLLLENLRDEDMAWSVRRMCGAELFRRERLNDLENVLRNGELGTRTVVIDVLSREDFFKNTWAADPSYRVHETLRDWLSADTATHRSRAIQLAKELNWIDGLPLIRPLLGRSGRGNVNPKQERMTIEAAASAVQRFGDCESVPLLLELARNDVSGQLRMRAMQELHRMVFEHNSCPGALSDDEMKKLVIARLNDDETAPRMAAMIIYKLQPAWAHDSIDLLKAMLADESRSSGERRLALEVLIAVDDPAFMEDLPRWFYDSAKEVRSSAAQAVGKYGTNDNPFLSSLIGVMRNERQNQLAFRAAAQTLHDVAGGWKGVPEALAKDSKGPEGRRKFTIVLNGLFEADEAAGVQRADFAVGWFRWHAERLQLSSADVDAAVAVHQAFWAAADQGDIKGAKAALDGDRFGHPDLFADARGWLAAQ